MKQGDIEIGSKWKNRRSKQVGTVVGFSVTVGGYKTVLYHTGKSLNRFHPSQLIKNYEPVDQ